MKNDRETFAGSRVTVVGADALELRLPRRPFRVVANPPYSTWATLLRRLKNLARDPVPLAWRRNAGFRGLEALPVSF